MPKRKRRELGRKPASREYRKVCWISAEGKTERITSPWRCLNGLRMP